jgi:hypothetical protein
MRLLPVILGAFPIALGGLWAGITLLTGTIGGWRYLGRAYPATAPFTGQVLPARNARMGIVGYGWSLSIGADRETLHLAVPWPFRVGHPTLSVPLDDVTMWYEPGVFGDQAVFRFRGAEQVRLRASAGTGRAVAAFSGGRLRVEFPPPQ